MNQQIILNVIKKIAPKLNVWDFTLEENPTTGKPVITKWNEAALGPKPSEEAFDQLITEEETKFLATEYKEKRRREYPPMADYLDGIVKGDQAQIQKYIDDCLAVKAKYPKP